MSGGHFDYQQYRIRDIADSVEHYIYGRELDEDGMCAIEQDYQCNWIDKELYEYCKKHHHTPPTNLEPATSEEFKRGYVILRLAEIYAQRMDWLICGDDGEETFHKRLAADIKDLYTELEEKDPELSKLM